MMRHAPSLSGADPALDAALDDATVAELVRTQAARDAGLEDVDPFTAIASRFQANPASAWLLVGGLALVGLLLIPEGGRRR